MASEGAATSSTWERRMHAEWDLLQAMARINADRLDEVSADDTTFRVTLRRTPSPVLDAFDDEQVSSLKTATEHRIRVEYPAFFPTVPMEVYLDQPVAHPNIHPASGFICLWQQHRVSNTVEHALHKTVAMLGWHLRNDDAVHIMQPRSAEVARLHGREVAEELHAAGLNGVQHAVSDYREATSLSARPMRKRLS